MSPRRPVYPRALTDVLAQPVSQRFDTLADGLRLLIEHIEALRESVHALPSDSALRGRPILENVMGEESAKVLILLDVARGGWQDQVATRQRLKYFYDHFVRGMYQQVSATSPGTFGEVHRYVETLRPDLYLDGPNDVDWIFRNEIESSRELAFYVDYVKQENTHVWVTPNRAPFQRSFGSPVSNWPAELSTRVVLAMARTGLLTTKGLQLTAAEWNGKIIEDSTTFAEHHASINRVLQGLAKRGLMNPTATPEDIQAVADGWPFPLNSIDLSKRPVSLENLETQRRKSMAAFYEQEYGPFD